jgi:hypothetical protein
VSDDLVFWDDLYWVAGVGTAEESIVAREIGGDLHSIRLTKDRWLELARKAHRLTKAAPDLLEALEALLDAHPYDDGNGVKLARAAIAKARGL